MHSDLFSLGPLTVHAYGLCMALGFLFAWQAAAWLCKKTSQSSAFLSSLITWIMIGAILGARVAYVLEHWTAEFRDNYAAIFRIDQGGLMFYGGFIGAAIVLFLYSRISRKRLFTITDLLVAVLPLGHAFGRIGCFMHGCCYGRLTKCALGVAFPSGSPAWWEQTQSGLIGRDAVQALPVLPTQLFEAVANAALFALLFWLYPKHYEKSGVISSFYLCGYGVIRFAMECLRGDPRMAVGPFSIGQAISVGMILLGLVIFACCFFPSRSHTGISSNG